MTPWLQEHPRLSLSTEPGSGELYDGACRCEALSTPCCSSWAGFRRIVAGGYLHPLPLWIYTDTSGTDPSLYKSSKV